MKQLQSAAQRLRESIQTMAQQPAGDRRTTAIKEAQQALYDTNQAMIQLPPELRSEPKAGTGKTSSAPATGSVGSSGPSEAQYGRAMEKLQKKDLDMIIANLVGVNLGFDHDDNSAVVLWRGGREEIGQTSKAELARRVIALIAERYRAAAGTATPLRQPRAS